MIVEISLLETNLQVLVGIWQDPIPTKPCKLIINYSYYFINYYFISSINYFFFF